jgi:hypothetical protein
LDYSQPSVQGLSLSPSRACLYRIPTHWVVHGRSQVRKGSRLQKATEEERARAARARVIARYWTAIGYLWLRTRKRKVQLSPGRSINFRQGFLTLTLPGVASADHKAVKRKVLDPFFTYARNVLGLRDYVWTAELQDRGEIHFHVLVNQFLDKDRLRRAWNDACARSGVVTMSEASRQPSTEIEAIRSYNGSKAYAAKYLGKALRSGLIVGRLWAGSHSVTGFGSITANEVEDTPTMEAITAELKANGHQWATLDREVHITRLETIRITRRRYPTLHRLLNRHIYAHDTARARAIREAQRLDDRRKLAPAPRMGAHPSAPPPPDPVSMVRARDSVSAKPGQLLQARGMGAEQGPQRLQPSHLPRSEPRCLRSGAGGRGYHGDSDRSSGGGGAVEADMLLPF